MSRRRTRSRRAGPGAGVPPQAAAAAPPAPPPSAPPAAPAAPFGRVDWSIALLLALGTAALFWPVHGYDFVNFDDVDYVRGNAAVRAGFTGPSLRWAFTDIRLAGFWIPLTWLSLMLDSELYGTGAGGYHVTNALLHVANAVLVFALLRRATGQPWPSALVAALFAVHPLHVESVAWVTERKDVLSTLFLLATVHAYCRYAARPTAGRYAATLVVFALGLMTKPMLTTMAALLLALDLWPLGRFPGVSPARLVWEKVPFLLLAVPAALVTMVAGHHLDEGIPPGGLDIPARLARACDAYVVYLARMAWPVGLSPHYPDHGPPALWRAALDALALAALTVVAVRMVFRRPYVTAGWLWYVAALVPVSGLVQIGHFATADRFTYVPLLGIFVIVAWGLAELATDAPRRRLAAGGALIAVLAAAASARAQLAYWRDGVTLFARTIAVTDDNPVAQYLLGLALADQGRDDEAMARYAESLRLRPRYAHAHTSLGLMLFRRGRLDEAIAHYRTALAEDAGDAYAHASLADALLVQRQTADALAHYAEAVRLVPDMATARTGYGRALAAAGRLDAAIAQYEAALALAPDNAIAHNNLANALADQGAVERAIGHYQAAIRLDPTYATARRNFAILLAEHGRLAEAAEQYAAALAAAPGDAQLHDGLGNVLAAEGRFAEAAARYEEALRLDPGLARTHNNLANALVILGRVDEGLGHYAEAVRLDPRYLEARCNWGMVLADRGRTDEAIARYREALGVEPAHADAHRLLGMALRAQGRVAEARTHLTEAVRIAPDDTRAQRELGLLDGAR